MRQEKIRKHQSCTTDAHVVPYVPKDGLASERHAEVVHQLLRLLCVLLQLVEERGQLEGRVVLPRLARDQLDAVVDVVDGAGRLLE